MDKIKIYIYGAGEEYNKFLSYTSAYSEKIEIIGIVTTERQRVEYLDGYPCIIAKEMKVNAVDYIIIAIKKWKEIVEYLKQLDIGFEKIILSNVFSLPYFDLETYLFLKSGKVTILANTCLAGFVYRNLGLEYNSPTIGLGCWGEDYLKFLENYKFYLAKEMKLCTEQRVYKNNPYCMEHDIPKGIINNEIVWDLPHSYEPQNTITKWNERRTRCNFENIAIVMVIHTDEDAIRFDALPYKKKVGIYFKDLKLKSVIYCPEWEQEKVRYKYDWVHYAINYMVGIFGERGKINWIRFLTDKDDYIRF